MTQQSRSREAVKRSIHFVLSNDFSRSLEQLKKNYCLQFWSFLDKGVSETKRKLRNAVWTVWTHSGPRTLSIPYAHQTQLIVDSTIRKGSLVISLKETMGKATIIKQVNNVPPSFEEDEDPRNINNFKYIWNQVSSFDGQYPGPERPIPVAVAHVITEKYKAPLPIITVGITVHTPPSHLTEGFRALARNNMPDEVFPEDMVAEAIRYGEVERLDHWTFKVNKRFYQDWRARVHAAGWTVKDKLKTTGVQPQTTETQEEKQ